MPVKHDVKILHATDVIAQSTILRILLSQTTSTIISQMFYTEKIVLCDRMKTSLNYFDM